MRKVCQSEDRFRITGAGGDSTGNSLARAMINTSAYVHHILEEYVVTHAQVDMVHTTPSALAFKPRSPQLV